MSVVYMDLVCFLYFLTDQYNTFLFLITTFFTCVSSDLSTFLFIFLLAVVPFSIILLPKTENGPTICSS